MMNLTKLRLAATGLLATIVLAACNMPITPTPYPKAVTAEAPAVEERTPEPAAMGAACVVGTWQVVDLKSYIQSMLPTIVEGAELNVQEVNGGLTYTFNADGSSVGKADQFTMKVGVKMNGMNLPGKVEVNGSSQGQYDVDESQGLLNMKSLNAGDLNVSASVAGVPVVSQTPVLNLFSFSGQPQGTAQVEFSCIGNQLQMTVDVQNMGPRVVTLERVR